MENIIIDDLYILQFYKSNPHIDINIVNRFFVDLFNKFSNNSENIALSSINTQILDNVINIHHKINSVSHSMNNIENNISSVIDKIQISKSECIDNIKLYINNTSLENIHTIENHFINNISDIYNKIQLFLHEYIPSSQQSLYIQLQNAINTSQSHTIHEMSQKIISVNNKDELYTILQNIESRTYNTIQQLHQPIMNSLNNVSDNKRLHDDLSDFLGKYKNSSNKGKIAENQLESVLHKLYPSGEIINTSAERAACDFRLIRMNKPTILFENKEYTRNIHKDEVHKFIRDIQERSCNGVFISNRSGITSKEHFEINIIQNHVVVYIHYADYSSEYISVAVRIIDELSPRILDLSNQNQHTDSIIMDKNVLNILSKEYSSFIQQKIKLIDSQKLFLKNIIQDMENLQFPGLHSFLNINNLLTTVTDNVNTLNNNTSELTCKFCSRKFESIRGLRIHEKKCPSKNIPIPNSEEINTNLNQNNEPIDQYFVVDTNK